MSASLLELASAANEAAIAYREARDDPALHWSYLPSYSATLLHAVDALTSAVVEAENDRSVDAAVAAGIGAASKAVMKWVDADSSRELIGCTPAMLAQIAVSAYLGRPRSAPANSEPFLVGEDSE